MIMKKNLKNMAWMLAATLMMAACSDTLDEGSGNGNSNEYVGDKGYVNIGINLPTTPTTRANDSFDDGAATEYKVNEVIIALFYDTKESLGESNAKCKCAFKLNSTDFLPSDPANDNITSYYASGVRMIPAPTGNVYALAIVCIPCMRCTALPPSRGCCTSPSRSPRPSPTPGSWRLCSRSSRPSWDFR